MFWTALIVWAIGTLVMELIRPKPTFEDARPSGLGDFNFPTATEGRVVPVVWGLIKVSGPNVVWTGDLRVRQITENVKTGIFSSDDVVVGHRYYIGVQFAICRGPNVALQAVYLDDKVAWTGDLTTDDSTASLSNTGIFGGDEFGNGGISGTLRWNTGSTTQTAGTYLAAKQSPDIGYRGTAYAVWEGGYLGNSKNITPWWFLVERIPDGLNFASSNPGAEEPETGTCNPMNVMYEILTDTDWGLSVAIADIDQVNLREAGDTLAAEGNGFAMMLDSPRGIEDMIREVERQIDGTLYFDRGAGQWRVKLARADYIPSGLPLFDESNIIDLTDYTRQTWEETTNQVRVKYSDNSKLFNESYALAQDMANVAIQGGNVSVDMVFPGVKTAANANKIAWRELQVLSYPLGKINIKTNREGYQLIPGSPFRFSWARLGVTDAVYRVSKINPGNLDNDEISIYAVQDVFAAGTAVFSDPTSTSWVDEPLALIAPLEADSLVVEAPRQMVVSDPYSSTLNPRMFMGARDPSGGTANFKAWSRIGTTRPLVNAFATDATVNAFLLAGSLNVAMVAYGAANTRPFTSTDIVILNDAPDDLSGLVTDSGPSSVTSLTTIAYIDGEFVGFEEVEVSGSNINLKRVYRGLFNTTAKAHVFGTRVWMIGQSGGNLSQIPFPGTTYDEIDVQLRSNGFGGEMAEGDVPIVDRQVIHSWDMPLPPRDPKFHGVYAPASVTADTQYTTETGRTGHDARAIKLEFLPRGWRIDDILNDHILDLSPFPYLDDSPTHSTVLTLDPSGTPIALAAYPSSGTETPELYLLRNDLVVATGANADIASTALVEVEAEHTLDSGVKTNPDTMGHTFTLTSTLQSDEIRHGGLTVNVSGAAVSYTETGVYSFDIFNAIAGGKLEADVDGAGYVDVITTGNSSGTLTTSGGGPYSVVLRFTVAPTDDQFFTVVGPTSDNGHGVLQA